MAGYGKSKPFAKGAGSRSMPEKAHGARKTVNKAPRKEQKVVKKG